MLFADLRSLLAELPTGIPIDESVEQPQNSVMQRAIRSEADAGSESDFSEVSFEVGWAKSTLRANSVAGPEACKRNLPLLTLRVPIGRSDAVLFV